MPQTVKEWFRTNIWVGQTLSQSARQSNEERADHFHVRHRKLLSFLIPVVLIECTWLLYAAITDSWTIFTETDHGLQRWVLSLAFILASMIAGASAAGGQSVAFPIMTLGFNILPSVARDFGYMVQSVGISAAAFSIIFMRIRLEYKSVVYCSIGGIVGIIISLEYISKWIPPEFAKMYYVSIWFAFAFNLFLLNLRSDRILFEKIPDWDSGVICSFKIRRIEVTINWKSLVLIVAGFIGGIFSGITGSGIGTCSFTILTLLFRVSEKTATPTSVVLMAVNALYGFWWRGWIQSSINDQSFLYLFVCIPVVAIGAPVGSIVASHLHRKCFARFVYVANISQLIGAFNVIKPWKVSLFLMVSTVILIVISIVIFGVIRRIGNMLLQCTKESQEALERKRDEEKQEVQRRDGLVLLDYDTNDSAASSHYLAMSLNTKTQSSQYLLASSVQESTHSELEPLISESSESKMM